MVGCQARLGQALMNHHSTRHPAPGTPLAPQADFCLLSDDCSTQNRKNSEACNRKNHMSQQQSRHPLMFFTATSSA